MGRKSTYSLRIACEEHVYDKVSSILQLVPKELKSPKTWWIYEVVEVEDDQYFDFINKFLDLLDSRYSSLEKLNISKKDITIWLIYEYDDQCNMEFDAPRLKRLGDNGISLCLSCYEA